MFTKHNANHNFLSLKSLHPQRKCRQIQRVDFLQHRVLIHIRVAFRKVETTLKVDALVCPDKLILDVSNKAKKKYILGRLGMIFALILYS